MTNIIVSGINGKMGNIVYSCVCNRNDCKAVGGLDITPNDSLPIKLFNSPSEIDCDVDVIIDFSHPSLLPDLLDFACKNKVALVICTTGYSKQEVESIKKASQVIPIFYSGNMSLGINLLIELSKKARLVFGDSFDVEIIERHHNLKIDAPSGTAFMIADAVSSVCDEDMKYIYDRHSVRKRRDKNEIGIHAVRGGTIVGEHEVLFAGRDETFSITHRAQSKEVFAVGAVSAAVYLNGKKPGMYNMSDMLS
ncbi:MAG: 4-hydroxy-tetrahydrodipicolinate reductase [Clostridia bacterium]|nr:4-hydroxy-tetrahydrodipicolinate reductase [Clostridia bacterium]